MFNDQTMGPLPHARSRLTLRPEPIPSIYRKPRQAEFQHRHNGSMAARQNASAKDRRWRPFHCVDWRRLTGWLAAYLLVLHIGFAGASTGHFVVQASDAGHEIVFCLNGASSPSLPSDVPLHRSHGKIHCVFCSGSGSIAPPSVAALVDLQPLLVSALILATELPPRQNHRQSPNQSRAPPIEV